MTSSTQPSAAEAPDRRQALFVVLGAIFLTNALIAEMVGEWSPGRRPDAHAKRGALRWWCSSRPISSTNTARRREGLSPSSARR
jgi:hypothetical protein